MSISVNWFGYCTSGDIPRTRNVYFFKRFGFEWVFVLFCLFFAQIYDGNQQHRPRKRYNCCVYTVSKLAWQHRKRNSIHSLWTTCCSWKDQWLQLDHQCTENWRAPHSSPGLELDVFYVFSPWVVWFPHSSQDWNWVFFYVFSPWVLWFPHSSPGLFRTGCFFFFFNCTKVFYA